MLGRAINHLCLLISLFFRVLRSGESNLIIAYSPPVTSGLAAVATGKLAKARVFVNAQDLYPETAVNLGLIRPGPLSRIAKWIVRKMYDKSDVVVVNSSGAKRYLVSSGQIQEERVSVIPNWIRVSEKARKGVSGHGIATALGDMRLICNAGTMGYAQDLEPLIRAFSLVEKHLADAALILLGDGVLRDTWLSLGERIGIHNLSYHGFLVRQDYLAVLAKCKVGIAGLQRDLRLPTVPSKIYDYMASGLPVVAVVGEESDVTSLLHEIGCGFAHRHDDIEGIAESLLAILTDPLLARQMGDKGRRHVMAQNTPATAADRFLDIYERL